MRSLRSHTAAARRRGFRLLAPAEAPPRSLVADHSAVPRSGGDDMVFWTVAFHQKFIIWAARSTLSHQPLGGACKHELVAGTRSMPGYIDIS